MNRHAHRRGRYAIKPSGRSGFTLIELLVVIGIIALLIAITLPVLNGAREASRKAQCAANERSIGQAAASYTAQTRFFNPLTPVVESDSLIWWGRPALNPYPANSYIHYGVLIQQNLANAKIYICPSSFRWIPAPFLAGPTTYSYDPARINLTNNVVSGTYFIRGLNQGAPVKLDEIARKALAMDFFRADVNNVSHSDGLNVLYQDTSVKFLRGPNYVRPVVYTVTADWQMLDNGLVQ